MVSELVGNSRKRISPIINLPLRTTAVGKKNRRLTGFLTFKVKGWRGKGEGGRGGVFDYVIALLGVIMCDH